MPFYTTLQTLSNGIARLNTIRSAHTPPRHQACFLFAEPVHFQVTSNVNTAEQFTKARAHFEQRPGALVDFGVSLRRLGDAG